MADLYRLGKASALELWNVTSFQRHNYIPYKARTQKIILHRPHSPVMALPLPIPRLHLSEIDDQSWFPAPLRASVQACLTLLWKLRFPLIQSVSPSALVAKTLHDVLGSRLKEYTFVDFCSGAGGPTPYIEREVNKAFMQAQEEEKLRNGQLGSNGHVNGYGGRENGVDFVMTDLHPHLPAWSRAAQCSKNLHYVASSVDAANAPADLLKLAGKSSRTQGKVFRLFSLAFHHFSDPLAVRILRNTLSTSDGFAVLELQGRDVGSLFIILMMGPTLMLGSWFWFWGQWAHLFWTYIIPVVPFVVVYDGIISCLRTRRDGEIMSLLREAAKAEGRSLDEWRFETGRAVHTWPTGTMQYFIGIKQRESKKSS